MEEQVRLMEEGEAKEVQTEAKKTFGWVEALFIGLPQWAYVIEVEGKIAGGMILKDISQERKMAYLDMGYISDDYQGHGLGRKLYSQVVDNLVKDGYEVLFGLIRGDNVASWQPIVDCGFEKASFRDLLRKNNRDILSALLWKTPFNFAYGMNCFILKDQEGPSLPPRQPKEELMYFLLINMVIALFNGVFHLGHSFYQLPLAYLLVLSLMTVGRYIGTTLSPQHQWLFQGTQGGIGLSVLLNLMGFGSFPIHGSYYPSRWRANNIRRDLALVEISAWIVLVGLVLATRGQTGFLRMTGQVGQSLLFMYFLPFYPMEEYGGQRIYRYSWILWLVMAVISAWIIF